MSRDHALLGLGLLVVLVGGIWTAQGLGYLAGSVMTGVTAWALIGPVVVLYGVYLVVRVLRNRRTSK